MALSPRCCGTMEVRNRRDPSIPSLLISSAGDMFFFVPHRRGQGRSPGPYIMDELNMTGSRLSGERGRREIELHETHLEDQLAALQYLRALRYVDQNRIGVMGASFGGIQTMLAVERGPG